LGFPSGQGSRERETADGEKEAERTEDSRVGSSGRAARREGEAAGEPKCGSSTPRERSFRCPVRRCAVARYLRERGRRFLWYTGSMADLVVAEVCAPITRRPRGGRSLATLVGSLATLLVWSCGGQSAQRRAPAGSASASVPESEFIGRYTAAICDNVAGCCNANGFAFDHAGCAAHVEANFELDDPAPRTAWDGAVAARCIDALTAIVTACNADASDDLASCQRLFSGSQPEGGACSDNRECARVAGQLVGCEYDPTGGAFGQCMRLVPAARGAVGDLCDGTCESGPCGGVVPGSGATQVYCYLADGLACDGVCAPLPKVGEPCLNYCQPDSYCSWGLPHVCIALQPDGASCHVPEECNAGGCVAGACATPPVVSAGLCSGAS